MLVGSGPVREKPPTTPTSPKRVGMIIVGAVLVAGAALIVVPMLLALAVDTSMPLSARLANLALFGIPTALVLVAGVTIMRAGTGHAPEIQVLPTTMPGRWAVGLVGGSLTLLTLFILFVVAGQVPAAETFFENLWAAVPLLVAWASAFAGSIAGVVAMGWRGERSPTVLAAVGFGLFVSLFGIGEALFPH